jgi:hypothetical protein
MYCKNCGTKVEGGSKFCGNCGGSVFEQETTIKTESNFSTPKHIEENSSSYIPTIIHKKSLRRLYFGYFLVILSVVIFLYNANYISNLISGPRLIDSSSLENEIINGDVKDINVSLQLLPNSVYQAGYTHITQTINQTTNQVESQTTDSEYYLTIIGKHVLVIEGVPNELPSGNFEGVVTPLSDELRNNLVADFNNSPDLKGYDVLILPYILSNKGMMGLDAFWGFLFGLILFCWGGFIVFKRTLDLKDKNNYIYQITSSSGYKNIDDLSDDFVHTEKTEMVKIGDYKLNNKFLFKESFFYFKIYPISQMYWAYKKITRHSVNLIPTGKSHEIVLNFKPKQAVLIKESEALVDQHLMLLIRLCPEAKFGYTK